MGLGPGLGENVCTLYCYFLFFRLRLRLKLRLGLDEIDFNGVIGLEFYFLWLDSLVLILNGPDIDVDFNW